MAGRIADKIYVVIPEESFGQATAFATKEECDEYCQELSQQNAKFASIVANIDGNFIMGLFPEITTGDQAGTRLIGWDTCEGTTAVIAEMYNPSTGLLGVMPISEEDLD